MATFKSEQLKSEAIAMLAELEETMRLAKQKNEHALDMSSWIQPCGTVACICGEQAIRTASSKDSVFKELWKESKNIAYVAVSISDQLDDKLENFLGPSIWGVSANIRWLALDKIPEIHTWRESLLAHPHVNNDHNDFLIAADYLKCVREICETFPVKEPIQLKLS